MTSAVVTVAALLTAPAASAASATSAPVTDLYVATVDNGGQDTHDCSSSAPCATIQHAIDLADPSGTKIHLGAGTFPNDIIPDTKSITVVGAGASPAGTVLSGGPGNDAAWLSPDAGSLTLESVEIAGPKEGAVIEGGALTATNVVFEQVPCALIVTGGTVTVSDSTIEQSPAPATGCSDSPTPDGGSAVEVDGGTVAISDSTFYDLASAITQSNDGAVTAVRSTFVDAPVGQSVALAGSLLSNDQEGATNCAGVPADQGYNLSSDASCSFDTGSGTSKDTVTGLNVDPAGPAAHGGATLTIALAGTSSAINAVPADATYATPAKPLCQKTDQRGLPRPQSDNCDAGAFEVPATSLAAAASPTVASPGSPVSLTGTVALQAVSGFNDPDPMNGTVEFDQDGTVLCSHAVMAPGKVSCSTTRLTPGADTVTATYVPKLAYVGSTATTSVTVGSTPRFTSPMFGGAEIGTPKTVSLHASGAPAPMITKVSGTLPKGMSFTKGAGTATISGTPAKGSAGQYYVTLKADNLRGTVTKKYTLAVALATPKVALAVKPLRPVAGKAARFKVTVSGRAGTPTGRVLLTSRSRTVPGCGRITLRAGVGTCTTTFSKGTRTVTARYVGDGAYLALTTSRSVTVVPS